MKALLIATAFTGIGLASPAFADCFDDAAAYHRVNPWVLRAIAYEESKFDPKAFGRNSNGSVDVGIAQINSVHFPDLQRYGISPGALNDPCTAIYVSGWLLSKKVRRHGNTWKAVGTYHSETPVYRDAYAARVKRVVDSWISAGIAR